MLLLWMRRFGAPARRRGGATVTLVLMLLLFVSSGLMYFYFLRSRALEQELDKWRSGVKERDPAGEVLPIERSETADAVDAESAMPQPRAMSTPRPARAEAAEAPAEPRPAAPRSPMARWGLPLDEAPAEEAAAPRARPADEDDEIGGFLTADETRGAAAPRSTPAARTPAATSGAQPAASAQRPATALPSADLDNDELESILRQNLSAPPARETPRTAPRRGAPPVSAYDFLNRNQ